MRPLSVTSVRGTGRLEDRTPAAGVVTEQRRPHQEEHRRSVPWLLLRPTGWYRPDAPVAVDVLGHAIRPPSIESPTGVPAARAISRACSGCNR